VGSGRVLDEARVILDAVLATDRADVPAVAQRRQLAAAIPPAPTLRPRCVVPRGFDDTYHHAAAELADAHGALDEQRRQDARIERRIQDFTDDLNELQPHSAPYDAATAAAQHEVDQAQERHRRAERAVTDSGPLGRRAPRRDLADATDKLATVETALAELARRAAPLLDRRNQLRHERDRLRDHSTTNRSFQRLLDDPETTVTAAQETVDALETWKRWATGHKVSLKQLVDAADILDHTDRADHTALAAPLVTWMNQHAPTPRRASVERDVPRLERPGLEISF
jgi:hypothetical protein